MRALEYTVFFLLSAILFGCSGTPSSIEISHGESLEDPEKVLRLFWKASGRWDEAEIARLVAATPPTFQNQCSLRDIGSAPPDEITLAVPSDLGPVAAPSLDQNNGDFEPFQDPENELYSVYSMARIIHIDKFSPSHFTVEESSRFEDQARIVVSYKDYRFPDGVKSVYFFSRKPEGWGIFRIDSLADLDRIPNPSFGIGKQVCDE